MLDAMQEVVVVVDARGRRELGWRLVDSRVALAVAGRPDLVPLGARKGTCLQRASWTCIFRYLDVADAAEGREERVAHGELWSVEAEGLRSRRSSSRMQGRSF